MSRNGTLEDALKSISDFNKHHREEQDKQLHARRTSSSPAEKKRRVARRGHELEASEEESSDADEGRKRREKKSSKDKDPLKKKKRHRKKRRKRDSSEDDEDETSNDERKVQSRAIRKKSKDIQVEGESEADSIEERKERREKRRRRKGRERLERQERKERRRQRRKRHESSSESSEEEDAVGTCGRTSPQGEANGVDALRAAQIVLGTYAELRSELVQLLSTLDEGQAVDISSIPDARLKSLLKDLFTALSLRRSPLGLYLLPETAPKTLRTLAPVLHDSVPAKLEPNGVGPSAVASHDQDAEALLDLPNGPSVSHQKADREDKGGAPVIGPALPTGKAQPPENGFGERAEASQPVMVPDLSGGLSEPAPGREEAEEKVEIGPAGPPPMVKKRVIGPAAPPPEVLEAAAKLTEAEEELKSAYEEDDVLIGPPPPAMIAEADNAPDKERFDEVAHILAPTTRDPYTLLRVKPDSSASEIKKRYWKVSLLVHPDKCAHPQAQQAFTVLNKAFKEVEDPAKRAIVDAKLEEIRRKAEFAEELKGLREAAQWRKLRGESQPGDEELLGAAPEEEARDTWMTELPPERQAGTAMPMQSTYFSAKERTGRGDTSAWTDNPQEKAKKAQQQYLEAYSQAMLGPATEQAQAAEKTSATAQIIDDYNSKKRSQTLVEKHEEALQKERRKKKKKTGEAKEKEEWKGSHPWKPWDREKDLAIGKTVKLDKDSSATALASRFGPGRPGERRFL